MKRTITRAGAIAAALMLMGLVFAEPATDMLDRHQDDVGVDAYSAAQYVEMLDDPGLSEHDEAIYRLAFAHGYWASENPDKADLYMWYVININSGKFHRPSCMGAKNMKEGNRRDVHSRRSEVVASGYTACKMCNP